MLPEHFSAVPLDKSYRLLNHGPTVLVSAAHGGVSNVMAAAWACVLDYGQSPKVTVVLDKSTYTRELLVASGAFALQLPPKALAALTVGVGTDSAREVPDKLAKHGVELFTAPGSTVPLVAGCVGWLVCKWVPEPHNEQTYELFIGEVVSAWADDRVFRDGHWFFESAPDELRTLHHVAGGQFYAIGEPVRGQVTEVCSHYQAIKERDRYIRHFGVEPPVDQGKLDVWPGYAASFIRRPKEADVGDEAVPEREALSGVFGLIPHWANDAKIGRQTFNARSETVAVKPSFRDAWKHAQHCIIPVEAIYEPDWRSGKAIATRVSSVNGAPLGIAGLWSSWKSSKGVLHSFTMLTINADGHALMCQFHKPVDEKRMVVILPPDSFDAWLRAKPQDSLDFMRQYPSDRLIAGAELPVQQALLD